MMFELKTKWTWMVSRVRSFFFQFILTYYKIRMYIYPFLEIWFWLFHLGSLFVFSFCYIILLKPLRIFPLFTLSTQLLDNSTHQDSRLFSFRIFSSTFFFFFFIDPTLFYQLCSTLSLLFYIFSLGFLLSIFDGFQKPYFNWKLSQWSR